MLLFREKDRSAGCRSGRPGFTLLELLIVLGIIGMLAAVSLPAIRGMRKANVVDSALVQLRDDLVLARQKAISGRTTVHVVFVPPSISSMGFSPSANDTVAKERLEGNVFRSYALFAERTVGDQPGRPLYRYLTSWKTLPDGVIIATKEFDDVGTSTWQSLDPLTRPFEYFLAPFPTISGRTNWVPHVAFDPKGRLTYEGQPGNPLDRGNPDFASEVIELREASVLINRDSGGNLVSADVRETGTTNAYNNLIIDGFTGQVRVDRPQIQ